MNWNKIHYFDKTEFECPCCGRCEMNDIFVARIDSARAIARLPFVITSGYRCETHNDDIGSAPTSSHCKGLAVDIRCNSGTTRFRILSALIASGFTRLGIGSNFIHVDADTDKLSDVVWTYYD